MKLRSSLFFGITALALLRCTIYDSDALGGEGPTSTSSKSASSGIGGDASTSTEAASSSSGSPDTSSGASTADTTATTTTTDTTTTTTTDTSASSSEMASSSTGVVVVDLWINELHYDNDTADVDEGVEIAGTAGADLTGWTIVAYNGSNGSISTTGGTVLLMGTIPNQMNGKGTRWFPVPGLENGSPDGVALVNASGMVVQFLSYEGTFTATAGPAAGMASVALPVSEDPVPAAGLSLQLTGSGDAYADFTWVAGVAASHDAINAGQTFQ